VIASLWNLPLARLDLGQLFRSHGAPEEALRQTLTLAESLAPLVLWMDEIDKTFHGVGESGSDTLRRLFGTLITWLQEKQAPVFVVATANQVDSLPPELLRKGRFDELFFVDLPDRAERESIFQIHLEKHGRSPSSFDLTRLSETSEHFSGAEIAECVVGALYLAFAEDRELQQSDLLRVVQETVPLYFTYEERIKELREWAKSRARNASRDTSLLELFETQQS
jgi:SpoVK/Ycf46/Vps4 family AAA+-type ATPase